jgi:DNA-binding MarR family transcriptional regulator
MTVVGGNSYHAQQREKGRGHVVQDRSVDDEALVSAVLLASRALVAIAARSLAAAPADVTLTQYRLLVLLASRGPQIPSMMAADLGAAPSSVTRLCDRLVAKGLIFRRASTDNRREVLLSISPAGRKVVDAVTRARRNEIVRVVRAVPAARRPNVIEALNDLGAAAGEVPDPSWGLGWE